MPTEDMPTEDAADFIGGLIGGEEQTGETEFRIMEFVYRIAVLEIALELACSDGWPDGEHVANLYKERIEKELSSGWNTSN